MPEKQRKSRTPDTSRGPDGPSAENDDARAEVIGRVMAETERRLAESGRTIRRPNTFMLYAGLVALFLAYLVNPGDLGKTHPIPVGEPVDWTGVLAPDSHAIGKVERLHKKLIHGPDDFIVSSKGVMYIGTAEGAVWRWPFSGQPVVIAHVGNVSCVHPEEGPQCGWPLGMALSEDEQMLYIVNAHAGLMSIALPAGHVDMVIPNGLLLAENEPRLSFLNEVVRVGDFLFVTETTTRWRLDQMPYVSLAADSDGRILKHDLRTGKTSIFVVKSIHSPNGISIAKDGHSLIVCEMAMLRLSRVDLVSGDVSRYGPILPGMPNSITPHPDGGHVVGMVAVRTRMLDFILSRSWTRRMLYKLIPLRFMGALADSYNLCVHVVAGGNGDTDDDDVIVVDSWHDAHGVVVDSAVQCSAHGRHMYLSSHVATSGLSRVKLRRRPPRDHGDEDGGAGERGA